MQASHSKYANDFLFQQVFANQSDWKIQTVEDMVAYRPLCVAETQDRSKGSDHPPCYMRCILEKMGLFTDTGGFDVDRVVKQLSEGRNNRDIGPEVEECVEENPQDINACTRAFLAIQCLKEADLELIDFDSD